MIYRYQKVRDKYTTITVDAEESSELATIDGWTYVHIPDVMPEQAVEVEKTLDSVEMTSELKAQIKAASPIAQHIRSKAVKQIAASLPVPDELKLMRDEIAAILKAINLAPTKDYAAGDVTVKAIRAWTDNEMGKIGL